MIEHPNPEQIREEFDKTHIGNSIPEPVLHQLWAFNLDRPKLEQFKHSDMV